MHPGICFLRKLFQRQVKQQQQPQQQHRMSSDLNCWCSGQARLREMLGSSCFPGVWPRCPHRRSAEGRLRRCEGGTIWPLERRHPNSTGTFFFFFFFFRPSFWGWLSLPRNIREKHSFLQLSLSVGFPIRNSSQAAALHFVIMTGKNEFLMCYLYQLQEACGSCHQAPGVMSLGRGGGPVHVTRGLG